MNLLQWIVAFAGRALIGIIFIAAGLNQILSWQMTEQLFTQTLTDWLATSIGNPLLQQVLEWGLSQIFPILLAAIICELLGGILLFLGVWIRLGSFLLFIFMLPTTLIFNHFWDIPNPERDVQLVNFMKNMGIIGGILVLLAYGKGTQSSKSSGKSAKNAGS